MNLVKGKLGKVESVVVTGHSCSEIWVDGNPKEFDGHVTVGDRVGVER